MPTLLLAGSESPRERYLTDMLLSSVRDVRLTVLGGQAHEGMTTAPAAFCDAVERFLLPASERSRSAPA